MLKTQPEGQGGQSRVRKSEKRKVGLGLGHIIVPCALHEGLRFLPWVRQEATAGLWEENLNEWFIFKQNHWFLSWELTEGEREWEQANRGVAPVILGEMTAAQREWWQKRWWAVVKSSNYLERWAHSMHWIERGMRREERNKGGRQVFALSPWKDRVSLGLVSVRLSL